MGIAWTIEMELEIEFMEGCSCMECYRTMTLQGNRYLASMEFDVCEDESLTGNVLR